MPTEILDTHQRWLQVTKSDWLADGRISRVEDRMLFRIIGTSWFSIIMIIMQHSFVC